MSREPAPRKPLRLWKGSEGARSVGRKEHTDGRLRLCGDGAVCHVDAGTEQGTVDEGAAASVTPRTVAQELAVERDGAPRSKCRSCRPLSPPRSRDEFRAV